MKQWILLLLALVVMHQASAESTSCKIPKAALPVLAELLEGKFSSEYQARTTEGFMMVLPVITRMWKNDTDGFWLSVKQIVLTQPEKRRKRQVYARRVYHLRMMRKLLAMSIYILPPAHRSTVSKSDLDLRQGCDVYFARVAEYQFKGRSSSRDCKIRNDSGGFIVSTIDIDTYSMRVWNRGFAENGSQLWGEYAPYDFYRI